MLVHQDDRYMCPLHHGILKNPVQTACGHRLCRECVVTFLGKESSKLCPVDDEDRQLVSLDTVCLNVSFHWVNSYWGKGTNDRWDHKYVVDMETPYDLSKD